METRMEEDEGDASLMMIHLKEDATSILSSIRHEKKLIQMKKRWLMGLPKHFKVSKRCLSAFRKPTFSADMFLPEPFLRDDDVFVEVARGYLANCVAAFEKVQTRGILFKEIALPFGIDAASRKHSVVQKVFLPMLDDLNINALCFLADTVVRKSVKFEKTRPRLKNIIKRHLPMIFETANPSQEFLNLQNQIKELFMDPKSFKENNVPFVNKVSLSYHTAAKMMLDRLDDLSTHALDAMRRKLNNRPCSLNTQPCTNRPKAGLVGPLRRKIQKLLAKVNNGDRLPELVARTLRVASLSAKLMNRCLDSPLPEFFEVPHEIEALQNEILTAIWSIPNVPFDEVKELQLRLDPDADVGAHVLRTKLKNFLIECLFQCDEIKIPESVLRTVSALNNYTEQVTSKEKVEDELECILNMGSCMRQLVWNLSEHPNIDQEFWGAYKDESEIDGDSSNDDDDDDVDDDDDDDDKEKHCSNYEKIDMSVDSESYEPTHMERRVDYSVYTQLGKFSSEESSRILRPGSGGKSLPEECLQILPQCHLRQLDKPCSTEEPGHLFPTLSELTESCLKNFHPSALQNATGNEYLIVEDICDEVSLFAHKLIGCLLEKLLEVESIHLDAASRSYLLGGASVRETHQGKTQKSSDKNVDSLVFIQTVNELIPSFPQSGMKKLMAVLNQS